MEEKLIKVATLLLTSILFANVALAQARVDWGKVFLALLFGELPRPCAVKVDSPQCVECLTYVKIIPLLFFMAIFFLIFYYLVLHIVPGQAQTPAGQMIAVPRTTLSPTEMKIVSLIATLLGIVILHMLGGRVISQLAFWVNIAVIGVALVFLRGILHVTGVTWIIAFILTIIFFMAFWAYFTGLISPHIERWETMCLR